MNLAASMTQLLSERLGLSAELLGFVVVERALNIVIGNPGPEEPRGNDLTNGIPQRSASKRSRSPSPISSDAPRSISHLRCAAITMPGSGLRQSHAPSACGQ